MTFPIRPRRSVLYMPGSNVRALEKARTLAADALIFDLEDAVAPSAKDTARDNVREAIATGGYGRREILVRINGLDSAWGVADATSIAGVKPDGVVIPKVECAAQVLALQSLLDQAGANRDLPLWCMIETPRGVLRAEEIAGASPRVAGLIMARATLRRKWVPHTRRRACRC